MMLEGIIALDSEDDLYPIDRCRRTRLIQLCPIDATTLADVMIIKGFGAWGKLFDLFESEKSRKTLDVRCYNLGGYEFSHMWAEVLRDQYEYTEARPQKGQWTALADDKTVYSVTVKCFNGRVIKFTDDMRRMQNSSMENSAAGVRKQHPEWWGEIDTKTHDVDYSDGWLDPDDPNYQTALRYAKTDVFSQAMIARWLHEHGYDQSLTSPGMGLKAALNMRYGKKPLGECEYPDFRFNAMSFRKKYPPLDREMQDIAEKNLLGGYVWCQVGVHRGSFVHLDYSSSYPYEYAFGKMFEGRIWRLFPDDPMWDELSRADTIFRWLRVSFDFHLKEGMMPAISGRECLRDGPSKLSPYSGQLNKKVRNGKIFSRLYTESYLQELGHHYNIENFIVEEMWVAIRSTGDFKPFIQKCYEAKNRLKREGLKDSAEYNVQKGFMNAGIHGKTITKTHRRKKVFYDGESTLVDEINEPTMNFMIGFTGMMNARERLLRHCRILIEGGHRIFMCDTDSIVTDGTVEQVMEILGNWVIGETFETELGRFEIEDDSKMLKRLGLDLKPRETFDEFRGWGLKRYLELRIEGDDVLVRKTAFAGMHEDVQLRMLTEAPLDGSLFEWTQTGKHSGEWGAEILEVTKHAKMEDIWFHDEMEEDMPQEEIESKLIESKEFLVKLAESRRRGEWD